MYLLPAIDVLGGKVVRLARGDYRQVSVYHGDPVAQAQLFEEQGARWLHVVDLDGARSGKPGNLDVMERILRKTLLKVELGGGVRSLETIASLVGAGASRIVLGTSLVADPAFVEQAVERYGRFLCAGIDAREGRAAVEGWRAGTSVAAEDLARSVFASGFRHLVYTDISRDGMRTGVDASAYERMAKAFGHPVIASGGVAGVEDVERLGRVAGSIEGVIAGRALYEGSLTVAEAVGACERATRRAEAAAAQADPCGLGPSAL